MKDGESNDAGTAGVMSPRSVSMLLIWLEVSSRSSSNLECNAGADVMFDLRESSSTGCGVVGVCAPKDGEAWDGKFDIAMTDLRGRREAKVQF